MMESGGGNFKILLWNDAADRWRFYHF
jgi:hypothetical protein